MVPPAEVAAGPTVAVVPAPQILPVELRHVIGVGVGAPLAP